ncbi:MAG: hypothetical protein V4568_08315 [Pseudomonadota bacterium]
MLNLQSVCEQLPPEMHLLLWACVLLWEHGLSKTKYGSTIGLLITHPLNKALKWLKTGGE